MSNVAKLIMALEDPAPAAADAFAAWARTIAQADTVDRAELERLDLATQRAHTAKPVRFHAFASLWVAGATASDLVADRPSGVAWFRVRERLAFDRSGRPDEARAWAGVKKTTPWAPVDGVDERTWQGRYTNHGHVAGAHHATCVRYRQNVVIDGSDEQLAAVSELWWSNAEDLVERFYRSEEAERLVGVDAGGFVDARRAHPTVTRAETLRVGQVVTTTRSFI